MILHETHLLWTGQTWICLVIQWKLKTSTLYSQLSVQLPPPSSKWHKESYFRAFAGEQLVQEFGDSDFKVTTWLWFSRQFGGFLQAAIHTAERTWNTW